MKAAFRHIRKKQNKGFTTVELIIVIVLIMILAGGLIFGITRWVEWAQFKRQNEYARTLFVAAQNQLTEYSESGQLEVLRERTGDALVVDVTKLKGKDGEAYRSMA